MKLSIRSKLEILISLLLAIISVFIYVYFPDKIETKEMESLRKRGRSIGEMAAYSTSSALFFHDEESARESLKSLDMLTDMQYVVITDRTGDIFVYSQFDSLDVYRFDPETRSLLINTNLLQITTPITNAGNTIGYVVIGFSLESIKHSTEESRAAIALISLIIFVVGISATMIISGIITSPLKKMVNTVRNIENGDLSQQAPIGTGDEIDDLARAFNHMVRSLKSSYNELEVFNKNLEKHVYDRTMQLNQEIEIRKKAQSALLQAKEYAERIVDLSPIAIFSIDTDQRITAWNRKATEITGYSYSEVLGKKCTEVLRGNCNSKCQLLNGTTKPVNPIECTIRRKDGQEIVIVKNIDTLHDNYGNTIGGIECFEDITYRRRLEEELQVRQRMDSLGNLAGGIAHDFNNLLMGIIGNLDMIRIEPERIDTEVLSYVEESFKLSQRAAKLIKNIQSLTNETVLQRQSFDVYHTAKEVFGILDRTTDKLIDKQIDIVPDTNFVYANEDQIHQVLLNLGTNSVNALTERGITVGDYIKITAQNVTLEKENASGIPDGKYVHITFEDNGIGMTESVRSHAFEPLFTTSRKSSKKGQGLGLAMVYNIITKNHNGIVSIDSNEGAGTTVHIWLTRGQKTVSAIPAYDEIPASGKGIILIVEDEKPIRVLTEKALSKIGYTVLSAVDGADGLEQFEKHQEDIDLVILDLNMPKMSGNELYQHIHSIKPDTRVIISSGQGEDRITDREHLSGFLMKPYRIQSLLTIVQSAMESSVSSV